MTRRLIVRHGGRFALLLATTAGLAACATAPPPGPSFAVMPRAGESFAEFQQHDMTCKAYAADASGQASPQDDKAKAAESALAGAGLGAAAGALLGSASGHAGNGAAIGAGSGLLLGSVLGGARGQQAAQVAQHRYDIAYAQCMTANGERVPHPAPPPRYVYAPPPVVYAPPPAVYGPPPPPPPPPPPGPQG